jgi:stearoyl-CoA desaturase (delta-9 desaturase)
MTTDVRPMTADVRSTPALLPGRVRALRLHRRVAVATLLLPTLATVLALGLWWSSGSPPVSALVLTAVFYAAGVLGISVGYHRLFTHRAFEAPAFVRWILGACGSMSAQGPLLFWIAEHRRHHQHADREGDPHSPVLFGFWHAHLGWMVKNVPPDVSRYALDALKDRTAFNLSFGYPYFILVGIALPALLAGAWDRSWHSAALGALWAGGVRIFLVHQVTFCVTSICHLWGARPFPTRDQSRNNWLVALVSFGEGWHNNHHEFPSSARHGLRVWEVDVGWWFIRVLSSVGLAQRVRLPKEGRSG